MLLRQMKYFAAIVSKGSFTEAAEECFISQSAISQQIQSLESELGVKLIVRENRKIHLTQAGEFFYSKCVDVLDEIDDICKKTAAVEKENRRKLRIGYINGYIGTELHRAVAEFTEAYPDVDIEIVSGTHEQLYEFHRTKAIDMSFSDQRRAFAETFHNFPVFSAYVHIELSVKNPLSEKTELEMPELVKTPCILITDSKHDAQERDYYTNYLDFKGDYLTANNLEDARIQVSANRGFLILEGVNNLPQMGMTIRRIPLYKEGKPYRKNYYAYWSKEKTDGYYQKFADILKRTFE